MALMRHSLATTCVDVLWIFGWTLCLPLAILALAGYSFRNTRGRYAANRPLLFRQASRPLTWLPRKLIITTILAELVCIPIPARLHVSDAPVRILCSIKHLLLYAVEAIDCFNRVPPKLLNLRLELGP
jgi:NADH:ubiquinone oxidoreductase subunit H